MENVTLEEIHRDMKEIKRKLAYISSLLTEKMSKEDIEDFEQALKEYGKGKTKSMTSI